MLDAVPIAHLPGDLPGVGNERTRTAAGPAPGLLAFLRLDLLLRAGVIAAGQRYGPDAAADSFRGLYLSEEQVGRTLLAPVAQPLAAATPALPGWDDVAADNPRWAWLRERYQLTDIELDVLLVAFGPDVDRRYERLYGYLQDDVSARRPTVDLALDLLTSTPAQRLRGLDLFASDAPLLRHQLVSVRGDHRTDDPPLIAHLIAADEQITGVLLGLDRMDRRLASLCRLTDGTDAGPDPVDTGLVRSLVRLVRGAPGPVRLCFHGPPGTGRRATACAMAARLGIPLLEVDSAALQEAGGVTWLARALREAELRGAAMYLDGSDVLWPGAGDSRPDALAQALARHRGVVMMGATGPWTPLGHEPLGVLDVPFTHPGAGDRRRMWRRAVADSGLRVAPRDLTAVSDRFRLSPGQIRDAALTASGAARLRDPERPSRITAAELFAAARRESGSDLGSFARRVPLVHGWNDLVVPDDVRRQLRELTARVERRARVLDDWGFGAKLSTGRGINALFAGPPGTGKTMAAGVIAAELGLDLFAIDLSTVVSKYIGETEKNLSRVFAAAADSDAILFFDEADALFGKRSDVRDAHDRYANIEIAYLLQRMEQYDGLAVLATNLRHHLDEAFTRRLQVVVDFPFPGFAERLRIWRACLPLRAPLAPDVDLQALARHRLAGGNIQNVVLGAAYLAAAQRVPIGAAHFAEATRREHQKMGKVALEDRPEPGPDP
jgi:AAA+ superfamily predicted ATPase